MTKEDVEAILDREPFKPFRIRVVNGKYYDVLHRRAARFLGYGVLVFIGMKEGSCQAEGYDRFSFDQISAIEDLASLQPLSSDLSSPAAIPNVSANLLGEPLHIAGSNRNYRSLQARGLGWRLRC